MHRGLLAVLLLILWQPQASAVTREVPAAYSSIQAAISAAADGDTVLVAPGTYMENLSIAGKSITLASHFVTTGDPDLIDQTIIDGGGGAQVIYVQASVGPGTTIRGFHLRHADDGVFARGRFDFLDSRVTGCTDGIDYNDGGGLVRSCVFEDNSDDGLDLDNDVDVVIEQNIIQNNGGDGIEIRLQSYSGPDLEIVIRDNVISGSDEDGIQLVSYDVLTSRVFHIERNLFANISQAAIGMMCCENTTENYQGASLEERVYLFGNTFVSNHYGVTGGDNLVALNNLFVDTDQIALKRVDGGSIAAHNLFFGNGTDYSESNVDLATTLSDDPLLGPEHQLVPGSPAVDAGTAHYTFNNEVVLDLPPGSYAGPAPDLGAYELEAASLPGTSWMGFAGVAAALAAGGAWALGGRRLARPRSGRAVAR